MQKNKILNSLKNATILYIESNDEIRLNFSKILKTYCSKVYVSSSIHDGKKAYERSCPEILITDLEDNGIKMLKDLRKHDLTLRIIISTPHSDIGTLVEAIELDISRYLIQPISSIQLENALFKAIEEVASTKDKKSTYLDDDLYYHANIKSIIYAGAKIGLNKKEAKLLDFFLENRNRLLSYVQIQEHIWPDSDVSSASLRTLVKNLRKKGTSALIQNISGSGYILQLDRS